MNGLAAALRCCHPFQFHAHTFSPPPPPPHSSLSSNPQSPLATLSQLRRLDGPTHTCTQNVYENQYPVEVPKKINTPFRNRPSYVPNFFNHLSKLIFDNSTYQLSPDIDHIMFVIRYLVLASWHIFHVFNVNVRIYRLLFVCNTTLPT